MSDFVRTYELQLARFSVHGVFQVRTLEWGTISFSRGSSQPRDQTGSLVSQLHWQAGSLPLSFPDGAVVDSLPANAAKTQETLVQPAGWEDPLEEGKATHSRVLGWKTHGQRSLVGYGPQNRKEWILTEHAHAMHTLWNLCAPPPQKKKKKQEGKKNQMQVKIP